MKATFRKLVDPGHVTPAHDSPHHALLFFPERAKASDARVLVHCLAGISRSATIAIGYIMKRMDMPLDEAYR